MRYPKVSENFRTILKLRKLTAQELADKAHIGKSSVSQYVNGSHCPSTKRAQQLADVLDCNPVWLMGLDDKMEKKKEKTIMDDGFVIHEKTTDEDKAQTMQLFEMILNLDPGLRAEAIDYILFLSQRERKDAHLRTKIQRIEVLGQVPVDSERLLRNPSKALSHYRELMKRKEESSQ